MGSSFLSSLSGLRKVPLSKEARAGSESDCFPSIISVLFVPPGPVPCVRAARAVPGGGPRPLPALQWGVRSTRGSSSFCVAQIKSSQHLQAKSCGWQTLCAGRVCTQGLLSSGRLRRCLCRRAWDAPGWGKAFPRLLCFSPRCPGLWPPVPAAGLATHGTPTCPCPAEALLNESVQHVGRGRFPGGTDWHASQDHWTIQKSRLEEQDLLWLFLNREKLTFLHPAQWLTTAENSIFPRNHSLRKLSVYKENDWRDNFIPLKKKIPYVTDPCLKVSR